MAGSQPQIAQRKPYTVDIEAGQRYAWCRCGMSTKQPFCDGAHKTTEFKPLVMVAERSETVKFCGCKHSATAPFCDGAHKTLP